MKPAISEAAFEVLLAQAGLPLSPEQKQALYEPYGLLEAMLAARQHADAARGRAVAHLRAGGALMADFPTIAEARS